MDRVSTYPPSSGLRGCTNECSRERRRRKNQPPKEPNDAPDMICFVRTRGHESRWTRSLALRPWGAEGQDQSAPRLQYEDGPLLSGNDAYHISSAILSADYVCGKLGQYLEGIEGPLLYV